MAQFELTKVPKLDCIVLKIPHKVLECTLCEQTNNHNITNHLPRDWTALSHMIYLPQTSTYQNVKKYLIHPRVYQ